MLAFYLDQLEVQSVPPSLRLIITKRQINHFNRAKIHWQCASPTKTGKNLECNSSQLVQKNMTYSSSIEDRKGVHDWGLRDVQSS